MRCKKTEKRLSSYFSMASRVSLKAPPRIGRPPKPREALRRNRIMLNLTDAEIRRIEDAAGDEPAPAFARRIVLRSAARRPPKGTS